MKKLLIAVGAGIGFIFGSRAGRGPWEQLESKARTVTGRKSVHDATETAKDASQKVLHSVKGSVASKIDDASSSAQDAINDTADTVAHKLDNAGSDK